MASEVIAGTAPVARRVRAYFAPVARATGTASVWDPGGIASFNVNAAPAPWIDLGWCSGFTRKSATKVAPLIAGAPGVSAGQVRTEIEALLSLEFESWGKLQLALTAGAQQMNVLAVQGTAAANGSGGAAIAAVPLAATAGVLSAATTASALDVGAAVSGFAVGDVVVVDVDYAGATGFVGSGVSGGYVKASASIGSDVDYVRRISLNVGRVAALSGTVLTLAAPLIAGMPLAGMQVSTVAGFCDREGGSFFQEWSGLFVLDGQQGDRVVFHYPRLQTATGVAESPDGLVGVSAKTALERMRLAGSFRALPVKDANDGELVVCFRSYLPGAMRAV